MQDMEFPDLNNYPLTQPSTVLQASNNNYNAYVPATITQVGLCVIFDNDGPVAESFMIHEPFHGVLVLVRMKN